MVPAGLRPAVPAKAGTYLPAARAAEKWTLAFAREAFEEAGMPAVLASGVILTNERGSFRCRAGPGCLIVDRNKNGKTGAAEDLTAADEQNRGGACSSKY